MNSAEFNFQRPRIERLIKANIQFAKIKINSYNSSVVVVMPTCILAY